MKIEDVLHEHAEPLCFLMTCVEQEIHALQEKCGERVKEMEGEHSRKMTALSDCLSEKAEELVTLYEKKVVPSTSNSLWPNLPEIFLFLPLSFSFLPFLSSWLLSLPLLCSHDQLLLRTQSIEKSNS